MKKLTILALTTLASAIIFQSCNDSADNSFWAYTNHYVLQTNSETGTVYTPCISVFSQFEKLGSAEIYKSAMPISGTMRDSGGDKYYEVYPTRYAKLEDINGTYKFDAVSEKQETYTNYFRFSYSETNKIGEVKASLFEYDKATRTITLRMTKPANATHYGLYAVPIMENEPYGNRLLGLSPNVSITSEELLFTQQITFEYYDAFIIFPMAINAKESALFALGEGKILRKDAEDFEPMDGEWPVFNN